MQTNYEHIDPIPTNKTVVYLNNFIISTTQFLNRFSYLCEQKLAKVSRDVQRIEITMSILETKLSSIEGIDKAPQPPSTSTSTPSTTQPTNSTGEVPPPPTGGNIPPPPPQQGNDNNSNTNAPPPPPQIQEENFVKVKNDERFKKYFKAIEIGAPVPQIEMRMKGDGINPSILNHAEENSNLFSNNGEKLSGDQPPPPPGIGENSEEESGSSEY